MVLLESRRLTHPETREMKKILGWIPAFVFLLGMVFLSAPDLFRRRLVNFIRQADASTRRRTESGWQIFWAAFYFRRILPLMGIKMPIKTLGNIPPGPAILVFNHRTAADPLVAGAVAQRLSICDYRWTVKRQMGSAPLIGPSFRRAGYAFVTRNGDSADKDRVEQMARLALADGASLGIFPEGTRYTGTQEERENYRHLRDPRRGGLQVYMDACPNYPIIFVCLDWRGLRGGKTIWDGEALLGLQGQITVWHMGLAPGDTAESVLEEGWTRMDDLLSNETRLRLVQQA